MIRLDKRFFEKCSDQSGERNTEEMIKRRGGGVRVIEQKGEKFSQRILILIKVNFEFQRLSSEKIIEMK